MMTVAMAADLVRDLDEFKNVNDLHGGEMVAEWQVRHAEPGGRPICTWGSAATPFRQSDL